MDFGIEVNSSTDGSLLISSAATSYAHYSSVYPVQAYPTGFIAFMVYYELSAIPNKKPIYFIEINDQAIKPVTLSWNTTTLRWVLSCIGDGNGYTEVDQFPKIHVFHSVNDIPINMDTFGLNVYKANGDLTYSSSVDSELLKIRAIVGLNQAANFTTVAHTAIPSSITRPAIMFSTYFHGVNSVSGQDRSWYNFYFCNGMLLSNSTTISSTLISFGGFPSSTRINQEVKYADTEYPLTAIIAASDYGYPLYLLYGGTANALTLTSINTAVQAAYVVGQQYRFRATAINTGAATINIDNLGAVALKTVTGAALPAGYIRTDVDTVITYDGVNFVVKCY